LAENWAALTAWPWAGSWEPSWAVRKAEKTGLQKVARWAWLTAALMGAQKAVMWAASKALKKVVYLAVQTAEQLA
jgi:hypothetical protein